MVQTIAERMIYGTINGAEIRIRVSIGAPCHESDGHWSCSFSFDLGDHTVALKNGRSGGVDSVQALLNALHGVGAALDRSGIDWAMFTAEEAAADGVLIHEDGFPRADLNVMFLGGAFRKRMQAYVASEAEQAMKTLSGRR